MGEPTNHSILWAIIHRILSWLYVIYFCAVPRLTNSSRRCRSPRTGWVIGHNCPNDTLALNSRHPADPFVADFSDPSVFGRYVLAGVIRQQRRRDDPDDRQQ